MTPKVKIFELSGFCDRTPNYVSWPNLVKIGRCEVAERSSGLPHKKTGAPRDSSQPHFAQNRPIAPKIPWTLSLLDVSMCVEVGLDRLHFAGLIPETSGGKIDFSAPKVITAFSLQLLQSLTNKCSAA